MKKPLKNNAEVFPDGMRLPIVVVVAVLAFAWIGWTWVVPRLQKQVAYDRIEQLTLHELTHKGLKMDMAVLLQHFQRDPNELDEKGESPLFFAVRNGDIEAVQLLLQHGAKTKVVNTAGETIFDQASGLNLRDRQSILQLLAQPRSPALQTEI